VSRRRERGQVLLLSALLIPVLLGMAGMAVDAGSYASDRRQLQNAADAIALAAAQELPDGSDTQSLADEWAGRSDIDPSLIDLVITDAAGANPPSIQVTISRPHEFAFIRALGVTDKPVSARATAIKVSFGGGDGIVPWAVEDDAITSVPFGREITIKYDANNPQTGNFGPIRVDGSDSGAYQNAVTFGSDTVICAEGTDGCLQSACPGSFPDCAETSPECDGEECRTKPGNMTGPTRIAVDHRMTYTNAACDTFDKTFSDPENDGVHTLSADCNPWNEGTPGYCDSPTDLCSRRVFIIPVIDEYPNGSSAPVNVLRFALVYLEGYPNGRCGGSFCEIKARFVKAELTTGGLSGVYDEDALIQYVRLAE
jgi:hypothetical protein